MPRSEQGRLVIVSGPSGVGKTTLMDRVIARSPLPLVASVSATTRRPRPGETDGVDYHFLTQKEFDMLRERGGFLETAEVFGRGSWYGTILDQVTSSLAKGEWVILKIDVQGAQTVMDRFPDAISIFVRPSSLDELQRRLRERGTETDEAIQRRLDRASQELAKAERYHYQVVNDVLDRAVHEICCILIQESETQNDDRRASGRGDCQ